MAPVLIVSALLATALTPAPNDQDRLQACLGAIQDDAEEAYEDALTWRHQGGGWPAEHCVSLALIALGQKAPGALRLREAALDADIASDLSRAIMLGQSGDAFLAAEEYDQALISYTAALEFAPHDSELLGGLARTYLALEAFADAEDTASRALSRNDASATLWRLRAEARLALRSYDQALSDIETARTLSPEDIDVLVLRGRIIDARRTG
jgi:tetratricopeptide (TPR) repeat protein